MNIDLSESFQHLSRAPIVEAVLGVTAAPSVPLEPPSIQAALRTLLPDYPTQASQNQLQYHVALAPGKPQQTVSEAWDSIRCASSTKPQSAVFGRSGFQFSRLAPYERWETFRDEAVKLIKVYLEIARPLTIDRLGLRFINRIPLRPEGGGLGEFLRTPPSMPEQLDLRCIGLLMQELYLVPDHVFSLRINKAVQPLQDEHGVRMTLILDIDTFTMSEPFEPNIEKVGGFLEQLRWLKNKAFFGTLRPEYIEALK